MHINNLDFKTLYFFSGGFLIILSLWTVKGKDFGREEDELATPPHQPHGALVTLPGLYER